MRTANRALFAGLSMCLLLALMPSAAGAAAKTVTATLKADEALFRDGASAGGRFIVDGSEECGGQAPACWQYQIELLEPGARLRVAVDASTRSDSFAIFLYSPDGSQDVGNGTLSVDARWTLEVSAFDPIPGIWTVRVLLNDSDGPWRFRMRAKLEAELPRLGGAPNLQALAPYELGFVAPASPLSGVAPDRLNPPGLTPIACTWDEIAEAVEHGEEPPRRCLRFSVGVYETGEGELDVELNADRTATQTIHHDDGTETTRPAGGWRPHPTHAHAHYLGFVDYELHRVVRDTKGRPALEQVGSGRKSGYHPFDQRMFRWHSFRQADQGAARDRCSNRRALCINLSAGWGDHYRWQRPGQYVPFPSNGSGDYVVRVLVDRAGHIAETDDGDNTAYAHIRIQGDAVTVCERGIGRSPWDPGKKAATEPWWESTAGCS